MISFKVKKIQFAEESWEEFNY